MKLVPWWNYYKQDNFKMLVICSDELVKMEELDPDLIFSNAEDL